MKEVYNVYLITGSNDSVINNTVSDILKQVNCDDNNKIIYNLKENTISDVIEEANTVSLFRSNKVILVYSSSIDKLDDEELIMYLNNYNKDVYLIFIVEKSDARKKIVKLINEKGISIDSDNVDKSYNKNYVVSYLKDNGYKMNSNVIECFLSRVSDNINDIRNELDKLFIYKLDDKNISLDDVKLITYDNTDNIIYEFTNALLEKDENKAISMYHSFIDSNMAIDYILASIYNSYKTLYQIKELNKNNSIRDISKTIGKKEYYVEKMLYRSMNYNDNELLDIIHTLAMIDKNYKSGLCNPVMEVELFILGKLNV
ncbi:dNA polymerase III [Clostridium sp. CAG:914]|jgi:DNA polymerase-3 subunit delta|nr:DNA polymerase III subunit delta [Clostridium sp.]CDE95832.1 dNA polymerase III [Clostridium sp. CAG:914]